MSKNLARVQTYLLLVSMFLTLSAIMAPSRALALQCRELFPEDAAPVPSLDYAVLQESELRSVLRGNLPLLRQEFAVLGIVLSREGRLLSADRSTRISRILNSIMANYDGHLTFTVDLNQGAGLVDPQNGRIVIGLNQAIAILQSRGKASPDVLLHEMHHFSTLRRTTFRAMIRKSFLQYDLLSTNPFVRELSAEGTYYGGFGLDEIAAYSKDMARKRHWLESEIHRHLIADLVRDAELLRSFSSIALSVVKQLREQARQTDPREFVFVSKSDAALFEIKVGINPRRPEFSIRTQVDARSPEQLRDFLSLLEAEAENGLRLSQDILSRKVSRH